MSGAFVPFLVELALKSSAALGAVFVAMRFARRLSAAERHCAWALAMLGLVALPAVSALGPGLELPFGSGEMLRGLVGPTAMLPAAPSVAVAPHPATRKRDRSGTASTNGAASAGSEASTRSRSANGPAGGGGRQSVAWKISRALGAVYVAAACVSVLYLVFVVIRVTISLRRLVPPTDPRVTALLDETRLRMRIRRHVRMLTCAADSTPWAWGVLRPVIVLPAGFADWPADARRNALVHELAHIARFDYVTSLLAYVCCAVYWFQPLAWLALKRVLREAEHACDDRVLLAGASGASYASQLHEVAARTNRNAGLILGTPMAASSTLSQRVASILDLGKRRTTVSRFSALSIFVVTAAIVAPLGAVTAQQNGAATPGRDRDAELAAILARGGPADSGALGIVVRAYVARADTQDAVEAFAAYIMQGKAGETESPPSKDMTECKYCSWLLESMGEGKPGAELNALLATFKRLRDQAYETGDGNLLVRLAAITGASRNHDAMETGSLYLLEGFRMGHLSDASKLAAVSFLSEEGQYEQAKILAQRLNDDAGSTLYRSASTRGWIKYLDDEIQRSSKIASRLLEASGQPTPSSSEYLPLLKTPPYYPPEAAANGEEGYVIVEFKVTKSGSTSDVTVVKSTDPVFDDAAVWAASQFLYAPRYVNGEPVEIPGVRNRITFVLERRP